MAGDRESPIICDARHLDANLKSVDIIARLQLAAKRLGLQFCLRRASDDLLALLALAGLAEALGLKPVGQPEHREQPRGAEEEGELGDLSG